MRRTTFPLALAAVVALAAACNQDAIGPGADLSADELSFLAVSLDETSRAAAGDVFALGAAEGPPESPGSVSRTFSFENTRPCPEGGEVTVAGSGSFERDAAAGTNELNFEATKTLVDCAFVRDDVTFTLNGDATLTVHVLVNEGGLLEREHRLTGTIQIVTSDGGEEECFFDIHSVFDPEAGHTVVSGEVCGQPVGGTGMAG